MLIIHAHNNHHKDREYIYDVVFRHFWGLEYKLVYEERDNLAIELDGKWLNIDDSFFQIDEKAWLTESSLPKQPLKVIELSDDIRDAAVEPQLPVIYGKCNTNSIFSDDNNTCYVDIFGSAFFMLTRYEEVVKQDRDQFDRFPARASLAYQEGFLERPIINEYLEILWRWVKKYKEDLRRRERKFSIMPTHDVDHPLWGLNAPFFTKLKVLIIDIIKKYSIKEFLCHTRDILGLTIGSSNNSYNNFTQIMDMDEACGLRGIYFIMDQIGKSEYDGNYDIKDVQIKKIVRNIIKRNHIVGLHPSFDTYQSKENIKIEYDLLNGVFACDLNNELGARQHYLRWECPTTWQIYDDIGLMYDMTVGYAEHVGYRCGICYEYPVFNIKSHERLNLLEYPLVVMDSTIFEKQYMGLSEYDAIRKVMYLREQCKKYGGNFVILWHNTSFMLDKNWSVYKHAINEDL